MLNPYARHIYLEELRPPEGYILDRAIATTFSLDLLTLLMAPLSMVIFEAGNKANVLQDPIAVMEALRQTSNKLGIFCQQGRISVPKSCNLLYSYLEKVVVEVRSPDRYGVFHPKIWILRFKSREGERIFYRFVCLSRNLTFDHSWDTTLVLDGKLEDRKKAFARNHPLADFVASLPGLSARGAVSNTIKDHIKLLRAEIPFVRFRAPEDFEDEIRFIPLGIDEYKKKPSFNNTSRLFIMSPFLSEDHIKCLAELGSNNILVSRPESIDALSDEAFTRMAKNCDMYIMSDGTEKPDSEGINEEPKNINEDLSGLHAKMYLSEEGWYAKILSGSANATTAAFNGKNVEFLTEIVGRRSKFGIDSLLCDDDGKASFLSLLRKYKRPQNFPPDDVIQRKLEETIELARRAVINSGLSVFITPQGGNVKLFDVAIAASRKLAFNESLIEKTIYPISLQDSFAKDMSCLKDQERIVFSSVSLPSLTSFYAIRLTAAKGAHKASCAFVLNLPTSGIPDTRDNTILQSIISDQNRFIRYLLFLLADDPSIFQMEEIIARGEGKSDAVKTRAMLNLPLFEEMVKAYSRAPEKIKRIKDLIIDIKKSEDGEKLFPEGFEEMVEVFLGAIKQ